MKTITKLFLVGLIALGMTACSNEDEVKFEGQPDATVSIRVVPSSNGPVVRATGNLSGNGIETEGLAAESAIKSLQVFLFDDFQGGIKAGYGNSDNSNEVTGIETTSGPKTIVVVANCSIMDSEINNKSDLLAKTKNLPVVITNGLPMTGMIEDVVVKAGQNYYGHATGHGDTGSHHISAGTPFRVTRVNARVAIVAANLALGTDYNIFDKLTDVDVAMFNVHETSKLFGESLVTETPSYLFGEAWPTTGDSYASGDANDAFLDSKVTFPIVTAAVDGTKAPYYYVNENASTNAKTQMMIILRGKPMKGDDAVDAEGLYTDADGFTYYPVWVNKDGDITGSDGDAKIIRNTQYNITLIIKGIGNPSIDPVTDSQLDVLVDVAPWLVVTQNVEWNTPTP